MGYKVFGIASSESPDRDGETMVLDGIDTNDFNFLKDEHTDNSFGKIGSITKAKKIMNEKDASDWRQKKCWEATKKPFLYFESELFDDHKHPNAQAAAGLIDAVHRRKIGNIRASIEGNIGERDRNDNRRISKARATSVVLTVQPVNEDCQVFPYHDLKKSGKQYPLNSSALIRLIILEKQFKKSKPVQKKEPVLDNDTITEEERELLKSAHKKVSEIYEILESYEKSLYTVQCGRCKSKYQFSKFDDDAPNVCAKCGNYITMSDFYKSIENEGDE